MMALYTAPALSVRMRAPTSMSLLRKLKAEACTSALLVVREETA